MTADIDALIGAPDTPEPEVDALCKAIATGRGAFVDAGDLKRPVTQNTLALIFDMDPATVKKRLLQVRPTRFAGTRPLYDFKEACKYLVEPVIDLDLYIRSIDVNKLPNLLNKTYWEAKRIRLKYMLEAGDAWHTEDVLEVFGRVAMTIKDRVQMWSENIREAAGLSDDQHAKFRQMVDDMQTDIHAALVAMPGETQTESVGADPDGEVKE
jgi:hypothetical protein